MKAVKKKKNAMIKYLNQIWVRQVCITAVLFAKVDFHAFKKIISMCSVYKCFDK